MKRIFLFAICLLYGVHAFPKVVDSVFSEKNSSFEVSFRKIPKEDRILLERFFQLLLRENNLGYTLFGQKPISVAMCTPCSPEHIVLEKGWKTWSSYKHLFPSDSFILKKEIFQQNEAVIFSLINKPQALESIKVHLGDFQGVFGNESPENILDQICSSKRSIFEIKDPRPEKLIGILLGYGERNALNFERETEIFQELNQKMEPPFLAKPILDSLSPLGKNFLRAYAREPVALKKKSPSLTALLSEMKDIFEKRQFFELTGSDFFLEKFLVPTFICWESNSETDELKQSYEKTRSLLREVYQNGSFLEVTLKQWTSSHETCSV